MSAHPPTARRRHLPAAAASFTLFAASWLCCSVAVAQTVSLTGLGAPGTAELHATYQVKDSRLNAADVYTETSADTGSVASFEGTSNVQWAVGFGQTHAAGHTAFPGDTSLNGSMSNLAVSWTDYFRLAPTGAGAAPPQLALTIVLHGSLSTDYDSAYQNATASVAAGIDDLSLGNQLHQSACAGSTGLCAPFVSDDRGLDAASASFVSVSGCASGCYVGLRGWTEVFTQSFNFAYAGAQPNAYADADYLHTATFHVDMQTPGWSIASVSGADYATAAVPEPASAMLLLVGIGLMAFKRTRRGEPR